MPPANATRVHFQDQTNGLLQTITTDPSRSIFPAAAQPSNANPATVAAVPAQPMRSDCEIRDDFGIREENGHDEEETGQNQGDPAQPLLRLSLIHI